MIDLTTLHEIEAAIDQLACEFQQTPGLLLTEEDLRCHLVAKFARIGDLGVPVQSADDGVLATAVHAEVPWFDDNDQLRLRPDITITDPARLSIHHAMQQGIPFPRKGCHFTGNSIVVELKFYRGRDGVRPTALSEIQEDVDKIAQLIERGRRLGSEMFLQGVVVVFGKYSYVCPEVAALARCNESNIKVLVRSAGLSRRPAERPGTSLTD